MERWNVRYPHYKLYNSLISTFVFFLFCFVSILSFILPFCLTLSILSYQLLYDPPGLLVTTNNVIPILASNFSILTVAKPINGNKIN